MLSIANIIITLSIATISYFVCLYMKNRRFWILIDKFNGDKTLPLLGNALCFTGSSTDTFKKMNVMWETYGRSTFKIQIMNVVFLILCEPENVEIILNSNKEIKKTNDYRFLKSWLGDGLLLSEGNKWRRQRKIITPAFHFKILEQFLGVFEDKGNIFIKKLSGHKGKVFDVYPLVTLCALDIICESAMGTNVYAQENSESEYVKSVYMMTELFHYRTFSSWKRFDFLYRFSSAYRLENKCLNILHGLTNKVIQIGKYRLINEQSSDLKKSDDNLKKRVAFLDLLLSSKTPDGQSLSDEVIREEVDTFMFEGHDTTTSCISFALYSLANNPNVQKLAFEEQLSFFGSDLNKKATYGDLQEMNYLDRIIKETLRLYPSVPIYGRTLLDDVTLPDGRIIPTGTYAMIGAWAIGNNPKYYPDPNTFDPDRFLFENMQKRHPFLNVPFSAGPRNCIGQKFALLEMKSLLSKVLRNYELLSAGSESEIQLASEVVLKSKTGMRIKIIDRKYQ